MSQFQENCRKEGQTEGRTYGQTDRWTEGQTLIHRTLKAVAGGPKT